MNLPERWSGRLRTFDRASGIQYTYKLLWEPDGTLWAATSSCPTYAGTAENTGIAMIDTIFDQADKNRVADAGCPL